jgi:GntR family transcriptional repressor for pyruvate dehydrogenase complex
MTSKKHADEDSQPVNPTGGSPARGLSAASSSGVESRPENLVSLSLAESAAIRIAREINSGALRPGDRLAPERDLARRLGLSRGALREGLRTLESVGLVRARVGQGRFVTDSGSDGSSVALTTYMQVQPSGDISAVRQLLEPAAVRDMPVARVAAVSTEAADLLKKMRSSAGRGAIPKAVRYHTEFHTLLVRYASSRLLRALLTSMIEASEIWQPPILQDREAGRYWIVRHQEILDALQTANIDLTADRIVGHLAPVFVYPRRQN